MQVKDVMTSEVEMIGIDATVREAAQTMAELDVGFLPVIYEGVGAGVVTDRDIVLHVVAAGLDPRTTRVGQILRTGVPKPGEVDSEMTSPFETVQDDQDVSEALSVMDQRNIRRVVVHDNEYRIVGVLSRSDVAKAVS
jgi:CBS domain-containing protein